MQCLPSAPGSPRARGINRICLTVAWRVVVLSSILLLGDTSVHANKGRVFSDYHSYDYCEGDTSLIANGVCDISVNTAGCGFDGGDCCECTCVADDGSPCDPAEALFLCRDPDAPVDCGLPGTLAQVSTATSLYAKCAGYLPHIRDGRCDEANNNANCGFDGGDCCRSTCAGGMTYACGDQGDGFDCRDPQGIFPRRRLITSSTSCGGVTGSIGDTSCDSANNNPECEYDGGDCCECTCVPDLNAGGDYGTNHCTDGNFNCLDPSASCESDGDNPVPDPTPSPVYISTVPSPVASPVASPITTPVTSPLARPVTSPIASPISSPTPSPVYISPVASPIASPVASPITTPVTSPIARPVTSPVASPIPSPTPSPAVSPTYSSSECGWPESYLGDGDCDAGTNTLACGWDGGDCCKCTCEDSYYYQCAESDIDCLDPYAPTECESDSSVTSVDSGTGSVPSPIYVSPEPSPTVRPASSPIASPLSSPTARPAPTSSTTETSSDRDSTPQSDSFTGSDLSAKGSDTPPPSDSFTATDGSVESDDSAFDDGSSADSNSGGGEAEGTSTSSATLTATAGMEIANWEVLGVLSAFVLGYYSV